MNRREDAAPGACANAAPGACAKSKAGAATKANAESKAAVLDVPKRMIWIVHCKTTFPLSPELESEFDVGIQVVTESAISDPEPVWELIALSWLDIRSNVFDAVNAAVKSALDSGRSFDEFQPMADQITLDDVRAHLKAEWTSSERDRNVEDEGAAESTATACQVRLAASGVTAESVQPDLERGIHLADASVGGEPGLAANAAEGEGARG